MEHISKSISITSGKSKKFNTVTLTNNYWGKRLMTITNGVAALAAVLWAFTCMPSANAQDADLPMMGTCTPRTQDQGPWDCQINKLIKVQCLSEKSGGYDEVWKSVRNSDEASELLKSIYLKLGGPIKFSQWLSCQGFSHVQMFSPAVEFGTTRVGGVSVHIGISYHRYQAPFPNFWLTYLLNTGGISRLISITLGKLKIFNIYRTAYFNSWGTDMTTMNGASQTA
jgi:hypothetical protein